MLGSGKVCNKMSVEWQDQTVLGKSFNTKEELEQTWMKKDSQLQH